MKQHHMTYAERIRLEEKLKYKVPVAQIAQELGFTKQTIYNEIRRGRCLQIHNPSGFYKEVMEYSADKGQDVYRKANRNRGRTLKIGHDIEYANYLEDLILVKRYSPAAALAEAKKKNFATRICITTLYNYIDQGVFFALTSNDLWEKPHRKKRSEKPASRIVHAELPSIEQRPKAINERSEYGHWEMDLIVGPTEGSGQVLLTLTERRSRQELLFKLKDRKAATVRAVFDRLERTTPDFRHRFKSISTDNGPEFLQYDLLRKSVHGKEDRFQIYYCHSYAAWEKGTNENHNRMIRRWYPKGTDWAKVSKRKIADLQSWMNGYPRRILNWKTPDEVAA